MNAHVVPPAAAPDAHAVYAPSSAHRWSVCTASAEAIKAAAFPDEQGEEAEEGTEAHHEIERCLGPWSATRRTLTKPEPLPVDRDHPAAYGVALVLDYVKKLDAAFPGGSFWIEQRVALTHDIWGRCDVCHWDSTTATVTIVDYKNGYVNVEAENNEQLLIYAAASIFTHHLPAKWIRLVVVQPNSFLPVPRVKQWVTDTTWLHAFASKMAAIPGGPKKFVAGEQCTYCPMFGMCPASRDVLVQLGPMLARPAADVPLHQRALFDAMEKPIADWFKAAGKAWTKDALQGRVPPGMKIVTGQTKRTWKDEAAARAQILALKGADALDPPTPAQAEKLGIPADVVERLAEKPRGAPTLASESDKRATWSQPSAAELFAGVVPQQ